MPHTTCRMPCWVQGTGCGFQADALAGQWESACATRQEPACLVGRRGLVHAPGKRSAGQWEPARPTRRAARLVVHADGARVAGAHEQVHEVAVVHLDGHLLQQVHQPPGQALPPGQPCSIRNAARAMHGVAHALGRGCHRTKIQPCRLSSRLFCSTRVYWRGGVPGEGGVQLSSVVMQKRAHGRVTRCMCVSRCKQRFPQALPVSMLHAGEVFVCTRNQEASESLFAGAR